MTVAIAANLLLSALVFTAIVSMITWSIATSRRRQALPIRADHAADHVAGPWSVSAPMPDMVVQTV